MTRKFLIAISLLFLLSTFNTQKEINFKLNFKVKKIIVENNFILSEDEVRSELSFLYDKNFIFLNSKDIKKKINKNSFIDGLEIKRIYPNKLKVKIFEKKPIAIIQVKKKKYYFTKKNKIISYYYLENFKNLPVVFGSKENFQKFYKDLKQINFPMKLIKRYYFFESKRWDILTVENQTVKLPINDYKKSLENFLLIRNQINFEKYKTFDYRVNNQVILK